MKIKFAVLTFFVVSLAFVLCGAGCGNIAASSGSSYGGGSQTGGGSYMPPVDNNPIVCTHEFVCNYIGEINGTYYHKTYCSICGFVSYERQECYPSFNCKECGHTTQTSSYTKDFIPLGSKSGNPRIIIVASKDFENTDAVEKYVKFKTNKGFTCVTKYYSKEISNQTIRGELKTEYEKDQNIVVLIMGRGGTGLPYSIPEFVGKNIPTIQGKERRAATDFWYGFYKDENKDLFPQAVVGRLSARNKNELESQINKIINMETATPTNKNIVLVQQKKNDGSTPFSDESTEITDYVGKLSGYNVATKYTNDPDSINSAINSDAPLLVSYSGHGGFDFWGDSRYNVNNIRGLTNSFYPIVLGVTCNSADFTYGDECVAEAFMRNSQGGAVGYIGASNVMITNYSKMATVGNSTIHGMIGSLFGDDKYKVHTLGDLYLAALRAIKMSNLAFSDLFKGYSIEVLNLFGDPTMSIDYISK